MKFYLTRHTQTNYNVLGLCNSQPSVDVHITDLGVKQAHQVAEKLAPAAFDIIFVSELKRTHQTAEIINEFHHKEIIVDGRLNDNDTGFKGKLEKEWKAVLEASHDKWNASFNDGESLAQAKERVEQFLDDLREKDYDAVLVVTHGWIIKLIFIILMNGTFEMADRFTLKQGEYASFVI